VRKPSRSAAWISSRVPQDPSGEDPGEGMSTGAAAVQAEEALPPSANCQQCAHSPFRMFGGCDLPDPYVDSSARLSGEVHIADVRAAWQGLDLRSTTSLLIGRSECRTCRYRSELILVVRRTPIGARGNHGRPERICCAVRPAVVLESRGSCPPPASCRWRW